MYNVCTGVIAELAIQWIILCCRARMPSVNGVRILQLATRVKINK